MSDNLNLDVDLVKSVLVQLIRSDGMEVSHQYLIDQHVYYIDNTSLIEELEELLVEYYYSRIWNEKGNVNPSDLFECYTPQFINYDRLYNKLEKKYNGSFTHESNSHDDVVDNTLNKYF